MNFREIKKQLRNLEDRVAKVEGQQLELQKSHTSSNTNPSSDTQSDTCKRRSPPDLQVHVHVHVHIHVN